MALTATQAAEIAKRHGLTLEDAAGLLTLAKDVDDANQIAASFAAPGVEAATRKLAADLFGRTPPAEAPPKASPDIEYVRHLFRNDT